jgi:peptide/nickel transport system permease protein
LLRAPQGAVGTAILAALVALSAAGPSLAPFDPEQIDFLGRFAAPSARHWFGGDQLGRDVFSRVVAGGRETLALAVLATLAGTGAGAVLGTVSAYLGGRADEAIMRTVDAVMAIPGLLLALLIASTLGASGVHAAAAVALAFIPGMARITRSVALAARRQDYVAAAIARGEGAAWIVLGEMLPNVVAPVIVEATIRVAFAIMLFATLSFLGLGAQAPSSDWGLMAAEARRFLHQAPWILIAPAGAIAATAMGFNLFGDGLRDALNPRIER